MKRPRFINCYKPYWFLAFVRIILVFVPQPGYIHPDEYFQSVEVLASNVFEIEGNVPWDFNVTFPIRSITVPYFTVGASYKLLKTLDHFLRTFLDATIITPYFLLVAPRLLICLLSFLSDYSMYKICVDNNEKYKGKLLVLSSSYVMVIYATRTFSNTIELILFSLLLYYVSDSMTFSNVIIKQHEYLKKRYDASKSAGERAKLHRLTSILASHNLRNYFAVGTITALGFFNRPTFLCYAVCPVFFWLYRGLGFKSVNAMQFHVRICFIVLSAVPTVVIAVIVDSFYFGYISWGEIGMLDVSIDNFVFPCCNFIKYNLNEKNLERHGLHPKYLHWFVNVPLLFNVLGVVALAAFGNMIRKIARRKYHLLPTVRSIKGLMTASLLAPLSLLSAFPHQEPRFIIPVVFPMVYLYARDVYDEPDRVVATSHVKSKNDAKVASDTRGFVFRSWMLLNVVFAIFYGFVHQGGVYPVVNYLSNELRSNHDVRYDIVTSHVYDLPQSMLLQRKIDGRSKFPLSRRVFVHEEGSKDLSLVFQKLDVILSAGRDDKDKLLLILPSSLRDEVYDTSRLNAKRLTTFYPHVSTEALPDVRRILHLLAFAEISTLDFDGLSGAFTDMFESFGLSIYEIKKNNVTSFSMT